MVGCSVFKLKLKYKVNIMIQRPVILLLLLMMVVWVGCGEDDPEKVKPNEIIWGKDNAKMALIPAGSFEMGDHLDNMADALPLHTVELYAFYMNIHEVMVDQFKQFVQESGYNYIGHGIIRGKWNNVAIYSAPDACRGSSRSWRAASAPG